jgi:CysZ protein
VEQCAPMIATADSRAPAPGFFAGVRALFSGFGFVIGNPEIWPLTWVPVGLAVTLASLLGYGAYAVVPGWVTSLVGPVDSDAGRMGVAALELVATVIAILLGALLAFALAQPLSGPALERIVRKQEAALGAPAWPATSFLEDVWRSLQSVLVVAVVAVPLLLALSLVGLLVPPATVITIPLKIVITAMTIAWDLCDYPLSIRGVPVMTRVRFVGRHLAPMLGFGFGLSLLSLLPCALLLVLPAGVAGAARLVFQIEAHEGTHLVPRPASPPRGA